MKVMITGDEWGMVNNPRRDRRRENEEARKEAAREAEARLEKLLADRQKDDHDRGEAAP